jgi:hypothetical protein
MPSMRRALGLLTLAVALGLLSATAAAQTCPPSDPLCANNKRAPSKSPAPPAAAESPAPTPAAPMVAAPDKAAEKTKSQRGVITLSEVTITGRIQKPIAAVDVSRIAPKLTLAELRQPFLARIEEAIYKDPF